MDPSDLPMTYADALEAFELNKRAPLFIMWALVAAWVLGVLFAGWLLVKAIATQVLKWEQTIREDERNARR